MEAFGIIGMTFGIVAMGLAAKATAKISKLEKRLKETGVLGKEYQSD